MNTQPELPQHNLITSFSITVSWEREAKISPRYNLLTEVTYGHLYPAVYKEAQVPPTGLAHMHPCQGISFITHQGRARVANIRTPT